VACAATFFGILFFFKDSTVVDRDAGIGAGVERESSNPAERQPPRSAATATAVSANPRPVPSGSATPVSEGAQAADPFPESSTDSIETPAEVSDLADADDRAAAITAVGGVATSDAMHVLEVTLRNDDVSRNRLLAVNSLRLMARQGDPGGAIRALLSRAMADGDANVAAHAREAFRELAP
jgi:hypothetical protein